MPGQDDLGSLAQECGPEKGKDPHCCGVFQSFPCFHAAARVQPAATFEASAAGATACRRMAGRVQWVKARQVHSSGP